MSEAFERAGTAIHYSAVRRGTPVFDNAGVEVGEVKKVLDNFREHILDGIVIQDTAGEIRFIDGPEVGRTFERGVFLGISAAEVAEAGPPEYGYGPLSGLKGSLGGLFKRR